MTDESVCQCDHIHETEVSNTKKTMLKDDDYIALSTLYKMFADPTRIKLLHALERNELCVCDLAALLGMTKSAISHQLKALKLSDLVRFRKEGQNVYYSLADDHVKLIIDMGLEHINE
ncbi:MAG: winged helix-turn-helix transcriptional regulator [Clostridia bacterium]|nr:winged helix-turn-helix transcriptional regulator [Clostridia bacterium]